MNRLALAAVLLAATATTASAGGFVGLGIGTTPAVTGDVAYHADGRSGRLELGYSFGRLSIEGLGSRFDLFRADGYGYQDTSLGIAGKYNLPLGDRFEVFGRLGLQYTDLRSDDRVREDYSGSGILAGAGFEYRIPLQALKASVFVDYTIAHSSLTSPAVYGTTEFSFTTRAWTLGATISF
ncbi:MAG TPA: outer membrane beta-barrel protein [Kofleriaceae bacterium]|nr:outer membrane beta-barrel protein [Kofleriaceae bacterium]